MFDINEAIKKNPPTPVHRATPFDKHPRLVEWLNEVWDKDLPAPYIADLLTRGAEEEGLNVVVSAGQVRRELKKRQNGRGTRG